MNARRGTVRMGRPKSSAPVPPPPETVPVRYIVVATTPEAEAEGLTVGAEVIINEDVRRRPVSGK